jgi:YggT family protein
MFSPRALLALAVGLDLLLQAYLWILFGRAIVSWTNPDPRNRIVWVLTGLTEPPRRVVLRLLPRALRDFPIDVAFLVLLGLVFVARGVVHEGEARARAAVLTSAPTVY